MLSDLESRAWSRMCRKPAPLDHSPLSYDRMLARAQAWRLLQRLQGRRVSLYQAIKE